jgi:hypothetical protein
MIMIMCESYNYFQKFYNKKGDRFLTFILKWIHSKKIT